jgi:hypothetical protein
MAKEIKSEVLINASPEEIWCVLMDFKNYPNWNPFIKQIEGIAQRDNVIVARIEPPGAQGMTFKPRVLEVNENKEFRWIGKLLIKGLFDGEHKFEIIDNKNGTSTFIQSEKFTGILVPIFKNMLEVNTLEGFKKMNAKLKEVVEKIE